MQPSLERPGKIEGWSLPGDRPCSDETGLLQLDPFFLISADKVTTGASDLIAVTYAVILDDLLLPAVPQPSLALLFVLEDLFLTGSAADGEHGTFVFKPKSKIQNPNGNIQCKMKNANCKMLM